MKDASTIPYPPLLALAQRHARQRAEAEDIVQDVLIAAVAAGRDDFSSPANRRWLAGAIRRRAAFDARSAIRRRQRETRWQTERHDTPPDREKQDVAAILMGLPKSLRVLAALALSGHTRAEILYLLGISDAAPRQRIRELKRTLSRHGIKMPAEMAGLDLDLAYGSIRTALLPALTRHGGNFATHDPDGHLFIVRARSQNPTSRQQGVL